VLGGLAVLSTAGPASAHDYIVSTSPAANSTQTKPISQVALTYDDLVLDPEHDGSTSVVQVTDAAGLHYETGCASVLDRSVTTPAVLGAAGKYTVTWRIVSADGHPVSGSFAFTYAPPAGATTAAGATSGPACGHSTVAATLGSSTSGSSSVGTGVLLAVGGVAVLAVLAVVIIAMTRRGRRQDVDADDAAPEP
jgi:hypothetical protein